MTIAHLFKSHDKDLGGGFTVRRILPAAARQSVGPFLFFDHMGPVEAEPGARHDVRPHPHIGLATVTYLFEGAIMHRDSLGTEQRIEPGAINWMTAGSGIVHSERTPEDLLGRNHTPDYEGDDQSADHKENRFIHAVLDLLVLNGNARYQRGVDIMRVHNVL